MNVMSVYYNSKNKKAFMEVKIKAIKHTDKIEEVLTVVIVLLASIGILSSLLQVIFTP